MFALIDQNNKVVGIEANKFDVVQTLAWVEIPPSKTVKFGFIYGKGGFTDPNVPDLPTAQKQQSAALSNACAAQILAGFASSALGVAYTYASDAVSQRNILLAAQSTKGGLLSCQDASGVWSRQPHTQAQAQQVLEDFVGICDAARAKLGGLEVQVNTATTVAAAQTVMWEEENG